MPFEEVPHLFDEDCQVGSGFKAPRLTPEFREALPKRFLGSEVGFYKLPRILGRLWKLQLLASSLINANFEDRRSVVIGFDSEL